MSFVPPFCRFIGTLTSPAGILPSHNHKEHSMDTTKIETMIAEALPADDAVINELKKHADEAARACMHADSRANDCHRAIRDGDIKEARIRAASAAIAARAAAESAARAWERLPYMAVLNDEGRKRAAYLCKEASQEAGIAAQYASGAAWAVWSLSRRN